MRATQLFWESTLVTSEPPRRCGCACAQGRPRGGPAHEHRLLTSRISQAPDLDTLAELCAQFGDRFNYINTTAAMHSLALLCAPLCSALFQTTLPMPLPAGAHRVSNLPAKYNSSGGCRAPKTRAGGDRDAAKSIMQSLFARFIGQLEEARPCNRP